MLQIPQLEELETLRRVVLDGKGEAAIPEPICRQTELCKDGGCAYDAIDLPHKVKDGKYYCLRGHAWPLDKEEWLSAIDERGSDILAAHRDVKTGES